MVGVCGVAVFEGDVVFKCGGVDGYFVGEPAGDDDVEDGDGAYYG